MAGMTARSPIAMPSVLVADLGLRLARHHVEDFFGAIGVAGQPIARFNLEIDDRAVARACSTC